MISCFEDSSLTGVKLVLRLIGNTLQQNVNLYFLRFEDGNCFVLCVLRRPCIVRLKQILRFGYQKGRSCVQPALYMLGDLVELSLCAQPIVPLKHDVYTKKRIGTRVFCTV